jgi:hypothetical protein
MAPNLADVSVLIFAANQGPAISLRESLQACAMTGARIVKMPADYLVVCNAVQPDVALLHLEPDPAALVSG